MKKAKTVPPNVPTPEPVPTVVVCSICGENWNLHQKDENGEVSTLECVRILKARLAAVPTPSIYVQPWYPNTWPYWPYRRYDVTCGSSTSTQYTVTGGQASSYTYRSPSNVAVASST